jgi:hypothetical protein
MKHTKIEIDKMMRKLMKDIDRDYYHNLQIYAELQKEKFLQHFKKTIKNCWLVNIPVHDDQSNKEEPDSIIIYVNDDTAEIEGYLDGSMGRPVPLKARLNNEGKYELTAP